MVLFLLIAFLLELVAFFSIAALAFILDINSIFQIIICLVLLSIVIGFWGIFMSPRAPKKLKARKYLVAKGIIYVLSAVALTTIFNQLVGLLFFVIWITDEIILYINQHHADKINK